MMSYCLKEKEMERDPFGMPTKLILKRNDLFCRELNELRKPSTDNPEILRFFRYMKAAKDGQDGQECDLIYPGCTVPRAPNDSPPMVSTFNDINKLVHARHLRFQQGKT